MTDPVAFEAAVQKAPPYFLAAEGCHGVSLHSVLETPEVCRLKVTWRTAEDHVVTFSAIRGPSTMARIGVAVSGHAGHGPWRGRLAAASSQRKPLIPPAELHALLRPNCARVDVWRTVYNFELAGVDAIVEWFKGSALRPFLSPLNAEEKSSFLAAYREEIAPSYPEFGGRTLLAFPRFFFVAQAKG